MTGQWRSDDDEHLPAAPPPPPRLGPAEAHRAAADDAERRNDFDAALRERFRAVVRGLEQHRILEVQRARTAHETADRAAADRPAEAAELPSAAYTFDEVVYGGRGATEDEYRSLAAADRFSLAPPPAPEPTDREPVERASRQRRPLPPLPHLLRDPRFWGVLAGLAALALLITVLWLVFNAPTAPTPEPPPKLPPPDLPPPEAPEGSDSVFAQWPGWLAFGLPQWLIAGAIVVWWRARRRGALVGEPRPVEVAANELLAGRAALYRRSADYTHVAQKLRAATMRRIRPMIGVRADAAPDRLLAAVADRIGTDPNRHNIGFALFGAVPDEATLEFVATQLEWIEGEIL